MGDVLFKGSIHETVAHVPKQVSHDDDESVPYVMPVPEPILMEPSKPVPGANAKKAATNKKVLAAWVPSGNGKGKPVAGATAKASACACAHTMGKRKCKCKR